MSRRIGLASLLLSAGGVFTQLPNTKATGCVSLDYAFTRVAQGHPELRLFGPQRHAPTALRQNLLLV